MPEWQYTLLVFPVSHLCQLRFSPYTCLISLKRLQASSLPKKHSHTSQLDSTADRMTPALQTATLLAIIATTTIPLVAPVGPPLRCPTPCPRGEVCTVQEVQCLIAPCPVFYECKAIPSPCLEKDCGPEETCVVTTGDEGYEEPKCVPVSRQCTNQPITCASTTCMVNTECKMVGCSDAKCVGITSP